MAVRKYNLALVPVSIGDKVVELAQEFSSMRCNYLLGEGSLPHVTLYHFKRDENDIGAIWQSAIALFHEKSLVLTFSQWSSVSFHKGVYWISLLPNEIGILNKMHSQAAEVLGLPVKTDFDAHMTLLNTQDKTCYQAVEKQGREAIGLSDRFILVLGYCDAVGQLTEIIFAA